MTYQDTLFTIADKVATITVNRPEVGNAFSENNYVEIAYAIGECEKNPEVSAIILTGAGRHFSTGGDISTFKAAAGSGTFGDTVRAAGRMGAAVKRSTKPTIAMVNGAAAGAGCSLALACDFRITTPKSSFIMAFVNIGLSGDTGGFYFLSKLIGTAKSSEMMMTGAPVGAEAADRLGLVTKMAEEGKLEETTMAFAKRIASLPPIPLKRQKELLMEFFYSDLDAYLAKEAGFMVECAESHDLIEAVDAFVEKRPGVFTGK